ASPTAAASRTAASPTAPATPPTQPTTSRAAAGTATSGLAVSLQQVSPTVAAEGEDTTVTATVRNTSGRQLTGVVVGVRQAVASMTSRKQVAGWAASNDPADGSLLASESVAGALAPGASTRVSITVPDVGAGRAATYGTVGVSIDAVAGTAYGRQHTFLGYQRIKQYQPLRFAVAIPLVLDANAALSGTSSGRAAAWQAVTGPGSRLDRILGATEGHDVSWILDPQLVQPPHIVEPATAGEEPSQTSSTTAPTPTPTASAPSTPVSDLAYAASSAELSDREELAARILAGTAQHPTVLLPAGDPDIVALAGGPTDTIRSLVDDASSGVAGLHATADVAWPADGSWSGGVEAAARAAYGPSLEGALVDSRWTTSTPATPTAAHRSADDLPLVVYDDTDSTLLGAATSRTAASVATQQLVADTAAIVTERPGTTRTVAVVAPRALDPDPTGLDRMLDALDEVPWISPASLTSAFEEARADTGVARVAQPQELPAATRSPLTPPVAAA
ncbi:DUF6049 family protein, partial [Nostocoides japonicum]|uniref:DUF6049 family protein n=1 Tax=Nostocoides japonicum TaxID=99481 RepID=UPI001F451B54